MKKTVRLLREGWYGNGFTYMDSHPLKGSEIDCKKLGLALTKFVPVCQDIDDTIGLLVVDENYVPNHVRYLLIHWCSL